MECPGGLPMGWPRGVPNGVDCSAVQCSTVLYVHGNLRWKIRSEHLFSSISVISSSELFFPFELAGIDDWGGREVDYELG